jgi:hypothetical protein
MIKYIKTQNSLYIIEISKSIEPKCTQKKNHEIMYLSVPMIFQSLMGPKKSRCDIPNATTQRCFHPCIRWASHIGNMPLV